METQELAERFRTLLFNFNEHARRPRELYVTDFTSCFKRTFFSVRFNALPEPSPSMVLGRLLHLALPLVLQKVEGFERAQFEVACCEDLGNGWTLKGKADMVTEDAIYEFKFARGVGQVAHAGYIAQLTSYLMLLKKPKGYVVLVDRESLDVRVLEVEPDEGVWSSLREEARQLADMIERVEVPTENSPRLGPWQCNTCVFNVVCERLK